MRLKQMFLAAVIAVTLAAGASAQIYPAYYSGYYYTSWAWPIFGMQCFWQSAMWPDGSGFYYDTCGGNIGWF
jgi:hypothetical protein